MNRRCGYYGGFDLDYAEYAGSPRDTADQELNNGNTIEAVRRRMFGRGFGAIRYGDGRLVDLDEDYPRATGRSDRCDSWDGPVVCLRNVSSRVPRPTLKPVFFRRGETSAFPRIARQDEWARPTSL